VRGFESTIAARALNGDPVRGRQLKPNYTGISRVQCFRAESFIIPDFGIKRRKMTPNIRACAKAGGELPMHRAFVLAVSRGCAESCVGPEPSINKVDDLCLLLAMGNVAYT
jgi:hypothetical protein